MQYAVIYYKDGTHYIVESKNGIAMSVYDLKTEKADQIFFCNKKSDCYAYLDYIKDPTKEYND